jgi:hypothetical protein
MVNVSSEKFYEFLKREGYIIFETIVGSQAYGTNTPESDIDKKIIYILPDYLYGFIPQFQINKDYSGFELNEFMRLIETANPTLLELLSSPHDCVISKHPVFDLILNEKEKFITKKCANSFGGYSRSQIKKAKGQNKMMNWEKDKVRRKNPIDFCFVIDNYGTKSLKEFLRNKKYEQKFCGFVNIPNARDLFALFYDNKAHMCFANSISEDKKNEYKQKLKLAGETVGLGYKGIEKEGMSDNASMSNNLRLSSIPKGENPVCIFSYNKDAYTQHCKDYNKYQHWLKNRNMQRWVDVENNEQRDKESNSKIDGKNMLHCMRLIDMSVEIAEGKGIIVKRPNASKLLDIRHGKVDLNTIIRVAEEKIKKMDELFKNSNLPNSVDHKFVKKLTEEIRKEFFKNK